MRTLRVADPEALYERDFYAWTLAQVRSCVGCLRSGATTAST